MNNYGYDKNGNIYIIKNNDFYHLDIDKNDELCLNKINSNLVHKNSDTDVYKQIHKQNMLHIKTIENALDELEDISDDDEKDKFTDIYEQNNDYKYNPEKKYFHKEINMNELSDEENINDRDIIIYQNLNDLTKINLNIIDDIIPSYESLIIDGNIKSNNLIFRTEIINDQPLYRITIFTDGNILLNIIGTQIKKFKFNYETLEIQKFVN